jgi:hypothetical protein
MKTFYLFVLLITTSTFAVESHQVDPALYADPIPVSVRLKVMDDMGIKPEQRHLFVVWRRVPLVLGGTNARDNLIVLPIRDSILKSRIDYFILNRVQKNMILRPFIGGC